MKWAFETLERYRKRFCMFNDDVQVCMQHRTFLNKFTWHWYYVDSYWIILVPLNYNIIFMFYRELQVLHLQDY